MSLFAPPAPRWFTIPAHRPFVDDLAAGLIGALGREPEALADCTVLTPTRRGARALAEGFDALPPHAAGLVARAFQRKGPWYRASSFFRYPEVIPQQTHSAAPAGAAAAGVAAPSRISSRVEKTRLMSRSLDDQYLRAVLRSRLSYWTMSSARSTVASGGISQRICAGLIRR